MLVLALLLILVAVVVGAFAIKDGGESAVVETLGQTLDTTIAGVFIAGAVTMLLLLLGVWLLTTAMARARRKSGERKAAKNRQQESVQTLEEERASLRAENERLAEQLQRQHPSGVSKGAATAGAAGGAGGAAAAQDDHDSHDHDSHDHTSHDHDSNDSQDRPPEYPPTSPGGRAVDGGTDVTTRETTGRSSQDRDQR